MEDLKRIELYQNIINELSPFEGEMLKQIKHFYRVGLTWTSNALEGNSLTESETKVLIEDGLTVVTGIIKGRDFGKQKWRTFLS